jgi:MinD superfamily P-loop ATPase
MCAHLSGVHDLRRILELSNHFFVPTRVVINKADLDPEQCKYIKKLAGCKAKVLY